MSTVAISVPSFTVLTLFALSPLIVVSSLFVVGINSCRKGGYPYSSFPSIMNYNIASCNVVFPFLFCHTIFQAEIDKVRLHICGPFLGDLLLTPKQNYDRSKNVRLEVTI
jgi:hypothetical protein